jgi:hypothetical protein
MAPEQVRGHATDPAIAVPLQTGARTRWARISAAMVAVATAAALFVWWRQPPAVPVVEAVTRDIGTQEIYALTVKWP